MAEVNASRGGQVPETKARRQPSLPARSPSASTLRVIEVYHVRQAMVARFYPLVPVERDPRRYLRSPAG